jgi:hypothetical protein
MRGRNAVILQSIGGKTCDGPSVAVFNMEKLSQRRLRQPVDLANLYRSEGKKQEAEMHMQQFQKLRAAKR